LHWKVEPPSVELNPRLALVAVVVAEGLEVIVVLGAVVSTGGVTACTDQPRLAGVVSVLPDASVALTEKVCEPTARPL
jgi:hypothetical protein